MPSSRIKRKNRKHSGTFLAELPAVLYLLFIGIAVPMLILGSMFGRAFLLYSATQDACIQAARSRSFTEAKTTMTSVFNNGVSSWTGLSGTPTFSVLVKPLTASASQVKTSPLPDGSIQISQNVYLARVVVDGQIDPLIHFSGSGGWQGMKIPGLTEPYPLTMSHVSYFENPQGLTD